MKKKIELRPMWATKDWSGEITEGMGFFTPLIETWGTVTDAYLINTKDGLQRVTRNHAHATKEEAIQAAKKQLISYADFCDEKAAKYRREAAEARTKLIDFQ